MYKESAGNYGAQGLIGNSALGSAPPATPGATNSLELIHQRLCELISGMGMSADRINRFRARADGSPLLSETATGVNVQTPCGIIGAIYNKIDELAEIGRILDAEASGLDKIG